MTPPTETANGRARTRQRTGQGRPRFGDRLFRVLSRPEHIACGNWQLSPGKSGRTVRRPRVADGGLSRRGRKRDLRDVLRAISLDGGAGLNPSGMTAATVAAFQAITPNVL